MLIRFTEFIKYRNKDVNLYILQEKQAPDNLSFRVTIKDEHKATFNMWKSADSDWIICSKDGPQWINDIKPQLISAINKRIAHDYSQPRRL